MPRRKKKEKKRKKKRKPIIIAIVLPRIHSSFSYVLRGKIINNVRMVRKPGNKGKGFDG